VPEPTQWIEADAYVFDIDGTLLNAYGGAHYNAFHSALEKHFGLTCKIDGVQLHGNTDIGILRAVLEREGVTSDVFDAKRSAALAEMCAEVERNKHLMGAELCPGISELVRGLHERGKILGIATGNLETIGWIKVDAAGLRKYFSFGAFSDGHETRTDIFRDALQQVRQRHGSGTRVCFVGDTPFDVEAAKNLGAPVIAVATGIYTVEQLQKLAPDLLLKDCSDILPHVAGQRL
jgi:phosphoglycolate phosphatase